MLTYNRVFSLMLLLLFSNYNLGIVQFLTFFIGGRITFPEFLKIMHTHCQVEKLPKEIVDAFKASDTKKNGLISAKHLRHLLLNWGELLSSREGNYFTIIFTVPEVVKFLERFRTWKKLRKFWRNYRKN